MQPNGEPKENEEEFELDREEEAWLKDRLEASLKDQREGKLIPWEAVFPPQRKTG